MLYELVKVVELIDLPCVQVYVARNTLCVSVFCVDGFNLFHLDSFLGSVNYAPPKGGELVKLQRVSTKEAYIRLVG